MLERAGIACIAEAAYIDESAIKDSIQASGGRPEDAALRLAEFKAQKISARHPDALVIGADQILSCDGVWFDKPDNLDTARQQLNALRGREHLLQAAVVVLRDGRVIWHYIGTAHMTMRLFSDTFLEEYLDKAGSGILGCVGAYQLEGQGLQLFAKVEGDYFTILGLPLLPLLSFLRDHGVMSE